MSNSIDFPLLDCINYKQFMKLCRRHFITTRLEALYFFQEIYGTVPPFVFDFVTQAYENGNFDD